MNPLKPRSCIAPSSAMKATQQGRNFLDSTELISLCFVTNGCNVFSWSVLLSISYREPRMIAIYSTVLGVFGTPMANNLKVVPHIWHWAFYLAMYG